MRWELGRAAVAGTSNFCSQTTWDVEKSWVPFVLQCILYKIITFFKHIYRVCTNRKWLQITTGLARQQFPPLPLTEAGGMIALYLQMH